MTSLVPLLLPALPPPLQGSSRAPSNLARSVRCAEGAFGDVLYVGVSDGGLHRYQLVSRDACSCIQSIALTPDSGRRGLRTGPHAHAHVERQSD